MKRRCATLLLAVLYCATASVEAQDAVPYVSPSPSFAAETARPTEAIPAPVAEAAAGQITLPELEQMALGANPTVVQAQARIQAARGNWLQSGLYPNPTLAYSGEEIGNEDTAGMQGAMVSQEFVTAGKLRLNRAVACQDIVRAERELAAQQFRVLTDVRLGFYRALVAQRRVELAQRLVDIAEQSLEISRTLYETAEVSQVDVLQTRIQLNTSRILRVNAQANLDASRKSLAAVVGVPHLPGRILQGPLDPGVAIEWDAAFQHLVRHSPEMAVAMAQLNRAQLAVRRARVEPIPNIATAASIHKSDMSGDTAYGVQAGIELPIFDRNQGNIQRSQADVIDARRNIDRVRLGLQTRLAEAFRQYQEALNEVEQYRDGILPDARSTLELVQIGYQQGEFGYLDLLGAQRTYFQSELAYLDALARLKSAESAIEGQLLSGSLQAEAMALPAPETSAGIEGLAGFGVEASGM